MKLMGMLQESLIFTHLPVGSKNEVLQWMAQCIVQQYPELDAVELLNVILEREHLGSTGIGSGIAIPHAKISTAKDHIASFGRSQEGIQFDAIDEKPVYLIFMIVGPVHANDIHLQTLARISKFLHDSSFREQLLMSETSQQIYAAIAEKDEQY